MLFIGTEPPFRSGLPRNEEFSKALYTIDIGQNDLAIGLQHTSEDQVISSIPDILTQFSQAVQVISNHHPIQVIINVLKTEPNLPIQVNCTENLPVCQLV
jgi:hypothetical protein